MKRVSSLVLAASVVVLTGCSGFEKHMRDTLPEPKPAYQGREIVVAPTRSVLPVQYEGQSVLLSHAQQAWLVDFLDHTTMEKANVVLVEEPMGNADPLTRRRAVEVMRWLERMGYKTDTFVPAEPPKQGRLLVAVDHVSASVPGCPDWQYHDYAAFGSDPFPNMACADRQNLAAMVADPNDLVVGAVPFPPMGDAPTMGEVNYRRGEIKEIEEAQATGGMSAGQ